MAMTAAVVGAVEASSARRVAAIDWKGRHVSVRRVVRRGSNPVCMWGGRVLWGGDLYSFL